MMQIQVYDENLNLIALPEDLESTIWTNRFYTPGDFELYMPASHENLDIYRPNRYVSLDSDPEAMIIEKVVLETDKEYGDHITVTGRCLKSILDRRIVWTQTSINNYVDLAVQDLVNKNLINPADSSRRVSNFRYVYAGGRDGPFSSKVDVQFTGDTLSEAITSILEPLKLGYTVRMNSELTGFEMQVKNGVDRSYTSQNNYVILSPDYENLIRTKYSLDIRDMRTVALVAGEGEGVDRRTVIVDLDSNMVGLNRRELYVDARDIQSSGGDNVIPPTEYDNLLQSRGISDLSSNKLFVGFSGESMHNSGYEFGVDFFVGDIVEVSNEYGVSFPCRVTEYTRSKSSTEVKSYPTLVKEA